MDITLKIAIVGAIAVIIGAFIKLLGDLINKGASGGLISTVIVVILALLGGGAFVLFLPAPSENTSTDKIAGTWKGATNWNEYQGLQNTISIKSGCVVGETCGTTRMDSQYWCAGDIVLSKINSNIFTFIQINQQGNVPDNGCDNGAIETMYLLSPDKLSWSVSRSTGNNSGTGSGVLLKQP
jgi:hypothetical protein